MFKGKRRPERERKERNGKAEESKGEERSSCVYCMRVEFYACLIWKWIAWECASMKRVEEAGRGSRRRTRAKERERKKESKRNRWNGLFRRVFLSLLPLSSFFLIFVLSLLPSRVTQTGQQTPRSREDYFLRSRFITQITHLCRMLKRRYKNSRMYAVVLEMKKENKISISIYCIYF